MKNKEYRICVCIDVEASSAEEAYSRVYDMMMKIGQAWESTDEWFEDGEPMAEEAMSEARMAKLSGVSDETTPSAPCSFCHATGFVGTNICQECRSRGVEHA